MSTRFPGSLFFAGVSVFLTLAMGIIRTGGHGPGLSGLL